jgi:hypothetical protein
MFSELGQGVWWPAGDDGQLEIELDCRNGNPTGKCRRVGEKNPSLWFALEEWEMAELGFFPEQQLLPLGQSTPFQGGAFN